jgi:hypothetical protein
MVTLTLTTDIFEKPKMDGGDHTLGFNAAVCEMPFPKLNLIRWEHLDSCDQ